MSLGVLLGLFQAGGLGFAPALRYRFCKVGEQYRNQQNDGNNQVVSTQAGVAFAEQPRHDCQQQCNEEAGFHDEHNRVLNHIPGVQLFYRSDERLFEDFTGQQLFVLFLAHITNILLSPRGSNARQWGPEPAPGRRSTRQRYTPRTQESLQSSPCWFAVCRQTR